MNRTGLEVAVERGISCALLVLCAWCFPAFCQRVVGNPLAGTMPGAIPLVNVGGGPMDAQFESMDFAQKILQEQNQGSNPKTLAHQKELVDSGMISALDLAAPTKAVNEFNQASSLLRGQHSRDAIGHLQKAIAIYPKFVSAHNHLGMAYLDEDDKAQAQSEFVTAVTGIPSLPVHS